jgi:CheY-like chemotaxis protein
VLSFARGADGRRERIAIADLLEETRRFATDMLPSSVRFDVAIDDDVPDTMGDATQLLQVLTNLVTNARDAMPRGGSLTVAASTLLLEDSLSAESFRLEPGRYVLIDVTDTGHGMSAEVAEKIFEPFFTTKSVGKGTGLGLASSLAIVRGHGGTLRVYSELDRGTRFSMLLPVIEDDGVAPRQHSVPSRRLPRGRGETVLVVDDDETIRAIAARTLENYGYRTATAGDGREAIAIVEQRGGAIDLVLTDMMMPILDGAATTAYLEEHYPQIPVIAASGLTSAGGASRSAGMGVAAFLPKPYTTRLLLTTLRDVLDEPHERDHDDATERDARDGGDAG